MIFSPFARYFSCILTSIGISSRHGAHQVAQKLTTSTWPRHWLSFCGLFSRSGNASAKITSAAEETGTSFWRVPLTHMPAPNASSAMNEYSA